MRLAIVGVVVGMFSAASGCQHDHYRDYRSQRCDPPPVRIDDLGDGRHYLDHHVYYDGRGYQHDYHHIHHYDD